MTHLGPLTLDNPLDISEARVASRRLSEQRRSAERDHENATREAAEKEKAYRLALSQAFVTATGDTAAMREANARAQASQAAYERDLAVGMVKVYAEKLKGLEGERAQLRGLMSWSESLNREGVQ